MRKGNRNMKLKRTITLAILAAVLSANLASCVASRDPQDTDTSPIYVDTGKNNLPVAPTDKASDATYETISKTVYARQKSTLQRVGNEGETVTVEITAELTCTAQSTNWYKVLYQGAEYYIARGRTTEDDLGEKTFTTCDKTMYVNSDGVNVRPYPSLDNFSAPIAQKSLGDSVKVIAQSTSTGWSKVEITVGKETKRGFIKTSLLTTNATGEKDYEKAFTAFATPKTVYIDVESTLNLRKTPYLPDDESGEGGGIIVGGKGVPRGTALEAIAEGTVNGTRWYKVLYQPSPAEPKVECYAVAKYLSETKPSDSVDPETLIAQYQFTKFDAEITAFPVDNSVNVRSAPSSSGTLVKSVSKGESMKAIAYGKSTSSDYLWCLVKLSDGKYGFASYEYLTTLSTGEKSPLPLSLEAMISSYGLTKLTETKTNSNYEVKLWSTPDGNATAVKTLPKNSSISIVAKGKVGNNDWYLVSVEGAYYFALQSAFN